uniref:F-box family protein n=1 Tax=Solanum tuberosum TaxID=4113 RepID=M1C410_SOLTU
MEEMKMNEEKRKTLTIWALKRVKRGIINVKLQELFWSSTRPKAVDQISQLPDALLLCSLISTDQTLVTTALSKRWHYLWN